MSAKPGPAPLLDDGFFRLKSRIIERTGHFYYQDKDDLLWERLRKRLRASGCADPARYLNLLDDPISGPAEWLKLEAEITIGETFFFRYAEQFTALRDTILPEIIGRKRPQKRLRIWSAGCATGAEPYSLAILVHQLLGDELGTWRVSIIGSDINESFLNLARQARFGKWALRSLPADERDRYFVSAGKEQWQLRPEFRSLVRFERHNLLSLLDGTSPLEFSEFDLILCRNVLIYFHPDTVTRVVGALRDRLLDEGWMLLGHAEPNPVFSSMMQALNLPGTVAYRRNPGNVLLDPPPEEQPPRADTRSREPIPLPRKQEAPAKPKKNRSLPLPVPAKPEPSPPSAGEPASLVEQIRAEADMGRFREAGSLCARALAEHPLDAALHFYQGLILQALKRTREAEKSFLNSIYLDKSFAMAHYHLGLLLLAEGRTGPGRRSLTNASRIAAAMREDDVLKEGDGLTARDLRNLVRIHLETAPQPRDGDR